MACVVSIEASPAVNSPGPYGNIAEEALDEAWRWSFKILAPNQH